MSSNFTTPHALFSNYWHAQHALTDLLEANLTAVNPIGIYSCISYLYTVERTLCADSSACSHTHQALRGKETYGVFCIRFSFKIASLLLSFPSMASWKDSNELETPCLLWHSMHARRHIPWLDIFVWIWWAHLLCFLDWTASVSSQPLQFTTASFYPNLTPVE